MIAVFNDLVLMAMFSLIMMTAIFFSVSFSFVFISKKIQKEFRLMKNNRMNTD